MFQLKRLEVGDRIMKERSDEQPLTEHPPVPKDP